MANIEFKIECDGKDCLNDFTVEKRTDARNRIPTTKELFKEALSEGWHIGFSCLCPECSSKVKERCRDCKNYVNKSMCPPVCGLYESEVVVSADDFCSKFERR